MGTIGSNVTPDSPGYAIVFGGEAEHMAHHRHLETAVEAITVRLTDVLTAPGVSTSTTTAMATLLTILNAAGLVNLSA